jgi:hypothetical protein
VPVFQERLAKTALTPERLQTCLMRLKRLVDKK